MDSTSINYGIDGHKLRNINLNIREESKLYSQKATQYQTKNCATGRTVIGK